MFYNKAINRMLLSIQKKPSDQFYFFSPFYNSKSDELNTKQQIFTVQIKFKQQFFSNRYFYLNFCSQFWKKLIQILKKCPFTQINFCFIIILYQSSLQSIQEQHQQKMMNIQDQMLMAYIDKIFDKYDYDKSGTLDQNEMTDFFNQLFQSLGMNANVTKQQSLQAIKSIDQNSDGGVDKKQLFDAFKAMMNKPQYYNQPPPPQYNPYQQVNHNPYGGYNPYQQPPPPPPQYQSYNYQQPQYPNYNSHYQNPQNQYMSNSNPYMQNNNTYPYTQNQRYGMGGSGWGRKN